MPLDSSSPSPGRVLLRACLWLALAQAAAIATAFLIAVGAGLVHGLTRHHAGPDTGPAALALALPATISLQITLLLADWRQGLRLGRGDLSAGLGAGPVQRRGLIAGLVVLIMAWVLVYIAALAQFPALAGWLAQDVPAALALPRLPALWLIILRLVLVVVMAPVAEELFFRGWLWTALRRSWGVWPTALCTGVIWLAMHALVGPVRVPILIPAAILLSLARHYGGSVRASLPVHMANNGTAMAIQLVALAVGR